MPTPEIIVFVVWYCGVLISLGFKWFRSTQRQQQRWFERQIQRDREKNIFNRVIHLDRVASAVKWPKSYLDCDQSKSAFFVCLFACVFIVKPSKWKVMIRINFEVRCYHRHLKYDRSGAPLAHWIYVCGMYLWFHFIVYSLWFYGISFKWHGPSSTFSTNTKTVSLFSVAVNNPRKVFFFLSSLFVSIFFRF